MKMIDVCGWCLDNKIIDINIESLFNHIASLLVKITNYFHQVSPAIVDIIFVNRD